MEWAGPVARYALVGLETTIFLSVAGMLLSIALGVVLALVSFLGRMGAIAVAVYVEVWRGLPLLVTLFFVFFALPVAHVNVSLTTSALVGLTLWGSANIAEVLRGAIQSIPRTQTLAATALAFRPWEVLWWVILPQAIRRSLPSTVGILASLIQATALASAFGTVELLEAVSRSIQNLLLTTGHSHAFVIYAVVLAVYFALCYPLAVFSRKLEARLRVA